MKYDEIIFSCLFFFTCFRSSKQIKVGGWHKALIQTVYKEGSLILDDGDPVKGSSQVMLKGGKL